MRRVTVYWTDGGEEYATRCTEAFVEDGMLRIYRADGSLVIIPTASVRSAVIERP